MRMTSTADERATDARRLSRAVLQVDGVPAAAAEIDLALTDARGDARLALEAERLWITVLQPRSAAGVLGCLERYGELAGDAPGERAMLSALAVALSGDLANADVVGSLLERAFRDGSLLAGEGPDSPLYALSAYALVAADRVLLAEAEMTRGLAAARTIGSSGAAAMALTVRGVARLRLGRIGDAELDGLAAIRAARESHGRLRALTFASAVGVVVEARAERGDDAGAFALLAEHGFAGDLTRDPQLRALLPRARAHLAAGRAAEALADASRAHAAWGPHADAASDARAVIALASTTLGDRRAALAAARAQLQRARAWRAPSAIACALRVLGLAHGDPTGIAMLQEAIAMLECSPAALEQAHCMVALGMLWRRNGQRSRALEALRAGADLAQRIGADVVAQRAREHLLVLGSRPRRLAFTGADALTASERRAAQLAAAGRTNREIAQELYLSIKTVESHLGRGFRKLGISSRTELASALAPPATR
jgi:DNA-binding CsgD family transcriptional regulator